SAARTRSPGCAETSATTRSLLDPGLVEVDDGLLARDGAVDVLVPGDVLLDRRERVRDRVLDVEVLDLLEHRGLLVVAGRAPCLADQCVHLGAGIAGARGRTGRAQVAVDRVHR